jgi:hypothetical protein
VQTMSEKKRQAKRQKQVLKHSFSLSKIELKMRK